MKKTDYPGVQQAADLASDKSQKYYIRLLKLNLLVGVIAALITIYNFEQDKPKVIIYLFSLILLVSSLGLTIAIKFLKYEDLWYQGRALAESAKTLTWRYVTCSENFESTLTQHVVETTFTDSLRSIQNQFPDLVSFMDNSILTLPSISFEMNRLRNIGWQGRLNDYIDSRIDDQINWYSSKAKENKVKKTIWMWIIITSQMLSIVSCLFLIFCTSSSWNFIGLFTTMAASAIAWLELKQYQSTIQAYTTATMELILIKSLGNSISSEDEFVKYVLDSENAISREHTMWLAQRRK